MNAVTTVIVPLGDEDLRVRVLLDLGAIAPNNDGTETLAVPGLVVTTDRTPGRPSHEGDCPHA